VAGVRQGVAAAVAQHVDMYREIEASAFAKAFNVPIYCEKGRPSQNFLGDLLPTVKLFYTL